MKVAIVIAAMCSLQLATAMICLPNACDTADCSSAMLEVQSCEGRIDAKGGFCGCCPACIKQLNEGESCVNNLLGAPAKFECGHGLECHPTTKQCVKFESLFKGPCHAELASKAKDLEAGLMGAHLPECLDDGSYAAVQCHEAVCMCVDKRGKQIGNLQTSVGNRQSMNCQCARDKDARKLSMIAFERSCDELGNYERLQCTRGTCFCVNDMGQKIESLGSRPEENKHELGGCLVRRRRQAVEQGACARELEMLSEGPVMLGARKPTCLEDGSYHPRQCFGSVCSCVDSQGKSTGHSAPISQASQMNCGCARQQADFQKTGMVGLTFSCDAIGNFNAVQCIGSMCHCVDANNGKKLEAIEAVPIHMIQTLTCAQEAKPLGACAAEVAELQQRPPRMGAHKPQCLEDGSYHPRQCREAVCTCVDSQGQSTGVSANVGQASKMTCGCARAKADFQNTGMVGLTYSCDALGNFNPVQCVGSMCHCVDTKNGNKLEGVEAVHISKFAELEC